MSDNDDWCDAVEAAADVLSEVGWRAWLCIMGALGFVLLVVGLSGCGRASAEPTREEKIRAWNEKLAAKRHSVEICRQLCAPYTFSCSSPQEDGWCHGYIGCVCHSESVR